MQEAREGYDDEGLSDEEHEGVGGVEGDRGPVALVKDRGGFGSGGGGCGSCSSSGESCRDGGIGRSDERCGGEEGREYKSLPTTGSLGWDTPAGLGWKASYSLAVTWAAMM